jgi:hypothetical protein
MDARSPEVMKDYNIGLLQQSGSSFDATRQAYLYVQTSILEYGMPRDLFLQQDLQNLWSASNA